MIFEVGIDGQSVRTEIDCASVEIKLPTKSLDEFAIESGIFINLTNEQWNSNTRKELNDFLTFCACKDIYFNINDQLGFSVSGSTYHIEDEENKRFILRGESLIWN